MARERKDIVSTSMDVYNTRRHHHFFLRYRRRHRQMRGMAFLHYLTFCPQSPTGGRLRYRQTPIALAEPTAEMRDVKNCMSADRLAWFVAFPRCCVTTRLWDKRNNDMVDLLYAVF